MSDVFESDHYVDPSCGHGEGKGEVLPLNISV
jgi:hypothetical protein